MRNMEQKFGQRRHWLQHRRKDTEFFAPPLQGDKLQEEEDEVVQERA